MEEDAIDAENDRRGTNTEGESEDGDEGEVVVFANIAEGVAESRKRISRWVSQRVSRTSSLTRSRPPNSSLARRRASSGAIPVAK